MNNCARLGFFCVATLACVSPADGEGSSNLVPFGKGWSQVIQQSIFDRLVAEKYDAGALEQPLWYTNSYSPICRMPLIDRALERPFEVTEIAQSTTDDMTQSCVSAADMFLLADSLANDSSFHDHLKHDGDAKEPAHDLKALQAGLFEALPDRDGLKQAIWDLVLAMCSAHDAIQRAFEELDATERERALSLLEHYCHPVLEDGSAPYSFFTSDVASRVKLVELLRKVRFEELLPAAASVYRAVDTVIAFSKFVSVKAPEKSVRLDAPFGPIVIGGAEDDVYEENAALLIDFGGDDRYRNNAGGVSAMGVAVLIDIAGNDTYEGKDFVQGAARCGVGALIDLAGDDRYSAGRHAQSAALCGFSCLIDHEGHDVYVADFGAMGFAIFGYATFCDLGDGSDTYRLRSMGLGAASTLGVALCYEDGGPDTYRAGVFEGYGFYDGWDSSVALGAGSGIRNWPMTDNYALYGGIGVMCDNQGDDTYDAAAFGMGGSYLFSLGICVDREGDDLYRASTYSLGTGCHLSAGCFLDLAGNDHYQTWSWNLGMSLDHSVGVFADLSGDDVYRGVHSCGYASKSRGVAICADVAGDDYYDVEKGCGYGPRARFEGADPIATFIDFGGDDVYRHGLAKNDVEWSVSPLTFGRDGAYANSQDSANMERATSARRFEEEKEERARKPFDNAPVEQADSVSTLARFCALDDVMASEDALALMASLGERGRVGARRSVIEAFETMTRKNRSVAVEDVAPFFGCKDPIVRMAALRFLWRTKTNGEAIRAPLIKLLSDSDQRVRLLATLALANVHDEAVHEALVEKMKFDANWSVRRSVAVVLRSYPVITSSFCYSCSYSKESDWRVRAAIVQAGAEQGKGEAFKQTLLNALKDANHFVRWHAANALIERHQEKSAIAALFPLTADEYGELAERVVIPYLEALTGIRADDSYEKRLSEWWNKEKESFDLVRAFELRQSLQNIVRGTLTFDERVAQLRKLRTQAPDHADIRRTLGDRLHEEAKTLQRVSQNLTLARDFMNEAISLHTCWGYHETLARIYAGLGEKQKALEEADKAVITEAAWARSRRQDFRDQLGRELSSSNGKDE